MARPPNPQTFGRRAAPSPARKAGVAAAGEPAVPQWPAQDPAQDDAQLRQWKAARRRPPLPWRQIYLMAGLSFGIASFVLPDDVNGAADWLLYGLAAASFCAGWRQRRA